MVSRPLVSSAVQYGDSASFWVEYPNGLVDMSCSHRLKDGDVPPPLIEGQLDLVVEDGRTVRIQATKSALLVIDMQNYFLHPSLRHHPTGLESVERLMDVVPALRSKGVQILWVNWGLTEQDLNSMPSSLARCFYKNGRKGLGSELPDGFGRLLMQKQLNTELYGPLQGLFKHGNIKGTDFWIQKNRISGLWSDETELGLFLKEMNIHSLLFAGVNADQCVLGTLADASFRGYDCIVIKDGIATTSPSGGLENVLQNTKKIYGFVTETSDVLRACSA